jgi:hypothetical protein
MSWHICRPFPPKPDPVYCIGNEPIEQAPDEISVTEPAEVSCWGTIPSNFESDAEKKYPAAQYVSKAKATIEGCVDVKNDYNEAFAQRLKQIDEREKMERQGLQKLIQIQEQSQKELVVHNVAFQQ